MSDIATTSDSDRRTQDAALCDGPGPAAPDFRVLLDHEDWNRLIRDEGRLSSIVFIIAGAHSVRERFPGEPPYERYLRDAEHVLADFNRLRVGKSSVQNRAHIVGRTIARDIQEAVTKARASLAQEAA